MSHQNDGVSQWDFRRFLGSPPQEELPLREAEIRRADPNQGDTPLFIGERLELITKTPELLEATGCTSEKEYLRSSMERLELRSSSAYEYRRAYRVQRRYAKHFRTYHPDLNWQDGYLGKLLLLDTAVRRRCKSNDDPVSMEEVLRHFVADTYREFKYYAKPGLEHEEQWKRKLKVWKEQIVKELKCGNNIYMLYYKPTEEINDVTLRSFILDVCKGAV